MSHQPLVSICIPCHNAAPYVGAALDSVLVQTWKNLEIIVVNDGSTDGSAEVLEHYKERGIRVIHQENRGQCAAANRAFAESTGDYIKFFDADDLISPEMIEKQMGRLAGRTDAVALSEWGRFHGDLGTFKSNPQSVWRDMEPSEWLVEAWHDARPMMQCALWLIPRPILVQCGGWDEELSLINDFEFFARVLCHSKEVLFTPEAVLYYRSGLSGSLSGQKSRRAVESQYHSLLRGTGHLLAVRQDPAAKLSSANMLQDFIYTYYPDHADLGAKLARRVLELGGSDLSPDGPPRFLALQRIIGWKAAKRIQKLLKK